MTLLKGNKIKEFLARPNVQDVLCVLVYGPDGGLVSERIKVITSHFEDQVDSVFSSVRLEGDIVVADPGRLLDEVNTVSLFGSIRLVRVNAIGKNISKAVKLLLSQGQAGHALVVIEGGDLKPDSALRKTIEGAKNAVAIPCYADTEEELLLIIRDIAAQNKLVIDTNTARELTTLLGQNRLSSRLEIDKLCLACLDKGEITLDDVKEICSDTTDLYLDELVDTIMLGDLKEMDRLYYKALQGGTDLGVICGAVLRHCQNLWQAAVQIASGKSVDQAMRQEFSRLFFKRRSTVDSCLRRWSADDLYQASQWISEAQWISRSEPQIARSGVYHYLSEVALLAKQQR